MFTREQKIGFFKELLENFETEEMRLYCEDMIETMPEYLFFIPASTSLKYHSKSQCVIFGQIMHILMFGKVMNYMLELKCFQEKFDKPKQRDALRCIPMFHDAWKCGNNSSFTVHKHPLIAGDWVRNTAVEHDIKPGLKDYIAKCCERHSGQYTTSNRDKTILPEPETDDEKLCHICDVLSSRANIDMIESDYIKEYKEKIINDITDSYEFDFGKYKGSTVKYVLDNHPDYLAWMNDNGGIKEPIRTILIKLKED